MYLKPKEIMERYSISRSMVNKMKDEMLQSGRYPKNAIIGAPRCWRIDEDAFQDYFENLEYLRHPNMRKYVKPYRKKGA